VLSSLGVPRPARKEKTEKALAMVRLTERATAHPHELSGGEQQRVALARAVVAEPRLLLFDEPLANLDVHLKAELEEEILALQQRLEITSLYVTHDPNEALYLGERIAILLPAQGNGRAKVNPNETDSTQRALAASRSELPLLLPPDFDRS
jgi:ABC-type nitrate/sulfonate/bicarbonate transport system ATPase subunit